MRTSPSWPFASHPGDQPGWGLHDPRAHSPAHDYSDFVLALHVVENGERPPITRGPFAVQASRRTGGERTGTPHDGWRWLSPQRPPQVTKEPHGVALVLPSWATVRNGASSQTGGTTGTTWVASGRGVLPRESALRSRAHAHVPPHAADTPRSTGRRAENTYPATHLTQTQPQSHPPGPGQVRKNSAARTKMATTMRSRLARGVK
jgi:hypothetical protein